MRPENINDDEKLLNLTRNLEEQLKIIDNCLKNLKQDLGGEIEDVDDYISFASRSCDKSKNLLNEISKHSGTRLKFYRNEYELEREKNILLKQNEYLSKYANDIIVLVDEKGIIKQVNEKVFSVYGYTQDELIGKPGKYLRPEELYNHYDEMILKVHQEEGTVYETTHQKKNGEKFFVEVSVRPFSIDGSKYLQAIIRDITERKKTEETIRHHSIMLDSVGQSVIAVNLQGEIIYWNIAAEKLYGWVKSEVIGRNFLETIPAEITNIKIARVIKKLTEGKNWSGELNVQDKFGNKFPVKINSTSIYNSDGKLIAFVGVSENLTEQKKREKELLLAKEKAEELNRLKSGFLANMSHEVRTPLIGILGYAEMILDESYDSELKEKIGVIYKSGKKLNETLDTILDISKIESEKIDITYENFNLGELISESVMLYEVLAEEKGVELNYEPGTNGLMAELDRKIFTKIINNLLSNAVKYTVEGRITVSSFCSNGKIRIEIADTGIGIPEDKQDIVFEPFRQVSEGYNRKFEGTGLGLTVTKMLVELMNGKITLESNFGKGSKFTIELPVFARQLQKEKYALEN